MKYQDNIKLWMQGTGAGGLRVSARAAFTKLQSCYKLLGDKKHILIEYISGMIAAANVTMLYEAASAGFGAAHRLHGICDDLLDGHGINPKYYKYYAATSGKHDLFAIYPSKRTMHNLYYLELFDLHTELSVSQYMREQEGKIQAFANLPALAEYYAILEQKLGAAAQEINDLILEHFVCARVLDAFRQGMLNEYHYILSNIDPDANQPIFKLWMETL